MINRQVLAHDLNMLLEGETRSLLRHLDEAKPYVSLEFTNVWADVEKMISANRDRADRLSALLHEFDLPEQTGAFEQIVAHLHFMAVDTLLPSLVAEMQQQLMAYRRVLEHASGEPTLSAAIEPLAEHTQLQLDTLEAHLATST